MAHWTCKIPLTSLLIERTVAKTDLMDGESNGVLPILECNGTWK